jgi:hypothetical protein
MELKEAIDKLKELIFTEQKQAQKFLSATLADGTPVTIEGDEVVVGAKVMVVTEDGEVEAPNGNHELADGTQIITEASVIIEVIPATEETPEVAEEELSAAPAQSGINDLINALTGRVKELEIKFEQTEKELKASKEVNKELFSVVEKIAALPDGTATQPAKNIFKTQKEEKFKAMADAIAKFKSNN